MVKKSLGSEDVADDCSNTNKNSIEISSDSESSESSVSGGLCEELRSKCQVRFTIFSSFKKLYRINTLLVVWFMIEEYQMGSVAYIQKS